MVTKHTNHFGDISERSRQSIFNEVVQRMAAQQVRSMRDGSCYYRGEYGRKCALGWLIPDHLVNESYGSYDVAMKLGRPQDVGFFKRLQSAHDNAVRFMEECPRKLINVAEGYSLDSTVVYKAFGLQK